MNQIHAASSADNSHGGRTLKIWQFLAVVAIYLLIVQGTTLLLSPVPDGHHVPLASTDQLLSRVVIPVGIGSAFVMIVTAALGRWDEIFVSRVQMKRLGVLFPIALTGLVLLITNYPGLATRGLEFSLLLAVGTLMVGFSEELLFRGIGVLTFRTHGYSEVKVAIITSVIFGFAHGSNIFVAGPTALVQALLTTFTGLIFYMVLRSTRMLVLAMAIHGMWDFSLLSSQIDPDRPWPLVNVSAVVLAALIFLTAILWKRLHRD